MTALRSWFALWVHSLVRNFLSRRMVLALAGVLMTAVVVVLVGAWREWSVRVLGQEVVLKLLGLFVLPMFGILFGAGVVGDEREGRTLVYLVTRPLARWSVYVAKWGAALPLVIGLALFSLLIVAVTASNDRGVGTLEVFTLFAPSVMLAASAYLAFFAFLGAVFRHATLIALAYVFFIEVFIGRMPGILKRISISFYDWSLAYSRGAEHGLQPEAKRVFLPIEGDTASQVLIGISIVFVVAGALWFSSREFRDL